MNAGSPRVVPGAAHIEGRTWTIERVWPPASAPAGGADTVVLTLEARCGDEVRGGWADAEGVIALLPAHADEALPAFTDVARRGRVVSHRPGRRAVVRLRGGAYAKVVAPGRARKVRRAHERAADFAPAFAVPQIVAHRFAPDQVILFTPLPGRSLSAIGADPRTADADWAAAWDAWRVAWVRTIRGTARGRDLPEHDVGDEAAVIRAWARHAAVALDAADLLCTAEQVIAGLPAASEPVLAHRDLHDGQLLWSARDGIGLIDLDTCARADPALDLGNLAAHAEFAARQGRWTARRAHRALDAVEHAAADLGVAPERLAAWRRAALFRVACVNVLRPRWRRSAAEVLLGPGAGMPSPANPSATDPRDMGGWRQHEDDPGR